MGKLGKKARKFAKKNLQSVERRKRKLKAFFKKKESLIKSNAAAKHAERPTTRELVNGNSEMFKNSEDAFRSILGDDSDEYNDVLTEDSDSDGFLEEDPECPYISGSDDENMLGEKDPDFIDQNKSLCLEITKRKRKLKLLLEKDKKFANYLDKHKDLLEESNCKEFLCEEGVSSSCEDSGGEKGSGYHGRALTFYTVDVWIWMVMEQPNESALRNLLNGFRAASRYGIDSDETSSRMIMNKEVFLKVVAFVLHEADGIFRKLLGKSTSPSKDMVSNLRNKSDSSAVRKLIKSYLRSSLYLFSQVTDHQILVFILTRLRASLAFFSVFPSLLMRLIQISVQFWVTGDDLLSLSSFLVLRDIVIEMPSEWFDTCLKKTYKAFISHSNFVEPMKLKHMDFLKNSLVEIYSLDIKKSYPKVIVHMQQLAYILRQAIKTKRKEDLKMISCWQYFQSINIWVKFIAINNRDHGLQPLLILVAEVILGIAHLYHGPRYVPLRLKCVEMLNELSSSSGVFIPVSHLLLDCFEHKGSNNSATTNLISVNLSSLLKFPKNLMKSQALQEESLLCAMKLLSAHFVQWSNHVAFPELSMIPLFSLKRHLERSTAEPVKRKLRQFIEQVERNVDFIQRRREDAVFSPSNIAAVELFSQLEKTNTAFDTPRTL